MNTNIKQIKESILPILQRYGVSKAALFGSAVKEQIRPDSDVDILVQIDKDISLLDFVGLKLELEQALKTDVDVVEYDTIKPLLRETILKEQQVILWPETYDCISRTSRHHVHKLLSVDRSKVQAYSNRCPFGLGIGSPNSLAVSIQSAMASFAFNSASS